MLVVFDNGQYFLKLDNVLIELKMNFINAFDILFKSFWVFNISYEISATLIFYFFEQIYNIKENQKASISEFMALILSD